MIDRALFAVAGLVAFLPFFDRTGIAGSGAI
jgi:hypothetical protein